MDAVETDFETISMLSINSNSSGGHGLEALTLAHFNLQKQSQMA